MSHPGGVYREASPARLSPGDPEKCPVDVTKTGTAVTVERKIFCGVL